MDLDALYYVSQASQNGTGWEVSLINYALTALSVVFYSSSNIPIKRYDCGDGVFFVWLTSVSIFICGFICHCIRSFPTFHLEPAIGGVLMFIGQVLNVTIIQLFGLGISTLVYSIVVVIVGWVLSVVGFLGMEKPFFYEAYLNYIGLAFCIVSIVAFSLIKVNTSKHKIPQTNTPAEIIERKLTKRLLRLFPILRQNANILSILILKALGLLLAIAIGLCYGTQFVPTYILLARSNADPSLSSNPLDYIFPQCLGVLVGGTLILAVYCAVKKNNPYVNQRLVLPGFLSGALLGGGTVVWGYSSFKLNPAISYPLVSVGSPALSTLYGICLFREIRGKRNYIILAAGLFLMTVGVTSVGFSRIPLNF